MATTPANAPGAPGADDAPLALPPAPGFNLNLPGLDSTDAITLVGRNRLSQALELEESPDNRYLRLSLYVLGGAALIFFPWAALTPISQVVHASGEVLPEGDVSVIQHLEGGIVSRVNVIDGEQVRKGEVLLELRPSLVESEYRATRQQLRNLLLQQQQLKSASRGQRSFKVVPGVPKGNKVSQTQLRLLNSRLDNRSDQLAAARATVGQKRAEVIGLNEQIALYRQQRKMWASLVGSGAASRLNLLNVDTKLAELKGARAEALKALAQARANFRGVNSGLLFEQNSQLAQLVNDEAVVAENIRKVRNQLERTKIIAPVSGVVSDLRFRAPGSVIGPGAVVLSVVPNNTRKIAEVRVPAADIGFVKIGQPVDVKLQPFDSTIYGSVPGKVSSIAANTVQDPDDHKYYYKARVVLERQFVDVSRRHYPIQVGMPLVADIKRPERSLLRYIFQPFTNTFNTAFQESR